MNIGNAQQIAVIGAGLAAAACAHALTPAGRSVHVFEKHRGPGRRLATRRVERVGRLGQICTTQPDHGAAGITAHSAPFQTADRMGAAADARRTGRLSRPARRLTSLRGAPLALRVATGAKNRSSRVVVLERCPGPGRMRRLPRRFGRRGRPALCAIVDRGDAATRTRRGANFPCPRRSKCGTSGGPALRRLTATSSHLTTHPRSSK